MELKKINWTILKPESPPNIPGTQKPNSNQRLITVGPEIDKFKQIPLPDGWSWVFPEYDVIIGENKMNHVKYKDDENYVRSMFDVIVTKEAGTIQKVDISTCTIQLDENQFSYTGYEIKPNVTVINSAQTPLVENIDYILSYENNKNVGNTAKVIIKGIGNKYTGSRYETFTITKALQPASKPKAEQTIGSNQNLADINWGDGWKLVNPNETIAVGETKEITLIRVDAANYENATCTVKVTRAKDEINVLPNPSPTDKPDIDSKPKIMRQ